MKPLKIKAWSPKLKRMFEPKMVHLWGDPVKARVGGLPSCPEYDVDAIPLLFTGFLDKNGKEIYDGAILSDLTEVDGKMVQSHLQVFWSEKTGAWMLDSSYKQDKSSGDLLSEELADFAYEVTGNVYEKED